MPRCYCFFKELNLVIIASIIFTSYFSYLILQKVESLSAKLSKKYPDRAGDISVKQNEALDNWEKLEELADQRKRKLADSYQLQKFLAEARELVRLVGSVL